MALNGVVENGGGGGGNFVDQIYNQFLVCRLCSNIYRQPKILQCQHTFCVDCIESHYEMDEAERPYRFLMSYVRDLTCPVCRARTPIPNGGIRRLPDNFLVANLSDVVGRRKPQTMGSGPVCEICRPSRRRSVVDAVVGGGDDAGGERAATFKCLDCVKMLCDGCAEMHRTTKVTATHGLFAVGVERDVECKTHRNETLRFYCEPCEMCICVLCAFHDHKDHEVFSLLEGLQRHRGPFETLLDDCRSRIDRLNEQLRLIDSCEQGMRAAEDQIRDAAIDSIAAVRQREKELLDELRQAVGEKTFEFLGEKTALRDQLVELENAYRLTEALVNGTNVELLMVKKEMRTKLETVLEAKLRQTPSGVRRGFQFAPGGCYGDIKKTAVFGRIRLDGEENGEKEECSAHGGVHVEIQTERIQGNDVETDTADRVTNASRYVQTETEEEEKPTSSTDVVIVATVTEPEVEHVQLTAPRPVPRRRFSTDERLPVIGDGDADDAPVASRAVGRRMFERSLSLATPASPPAAEVARKIPNFGRPKPAAAELVDRGTEMERVATAEAGTSTPKTAVYEKETSTEYVIQVHKNVATENQALVDKGTSTSSDVTAAYRNVATTRRTTSVSRGTCTTRPATSERATSPAAALRMQPIVLQNPAMTAKIPTSPTARVATSVSIVTHRAPTTISGDPMPAAAVGAFATTGPAAPATSAAAMTQPVVMQSAQGAAQQLPPTSGNLSGRARAMVTGAPMSQGIAQQAMSNAAQPLLLTSGNVAPGAIAPAATRAPLMGTAAVAAASAKQPFAIQAASNAAQQSMLVSRNMVPGAGRAQVIGGPPNQPVVQQATTNAASANQPFAMQTTSNAVQQSMLMSRNMVPGAGRAQVTGVSANQPVVQQVTTNSAQQLMLTPGNVMVPPTPRFAATGSPVAGSVAAVAAASASRQQVAQQATPNVAQQSMMTSGNMVPGASGFAAAGAPVTGPATPAANPARQPVSLQLTSNTAQQSMTGNAAPGTPPAARAPASWAAAVAAPARQQLVQQTGSYPQQPPIASPRTPTATTPAAAPGFAPAVSMTSPSPSISMPTPPMTSKPGQPYPSMGGVSYPNRQGPVLNRVAGVETASFSSPAAKQP